MDELKNRQTYRHQQARVFPTSSNAAQCKNQHNDDTASDDK